MLILVDFVCIIFLFSVDTVRPRGTWSPFGHGLTFLLYFEPVCGWGPPNAFNFRGEEVKNLKKNRKGLHSFKTVILSVRTIKMGNHGKSSRTGSWRHLLVGNSFKVKQDCEKHCAFQNKIFWRSSKSWIQFRSKQTEFPVSWDLEM